MACAGFAHLVPRCSSFGVAWRACLRTLETSPRPPRVAEWLVQHAVARSTYADALVGDLEEEFLRATGRSPAAANRWYWRRAVSISLRYLPSRPRPRRSHPTGDPGMTTFLNDL